MAELALFRPAEALSAEARLAEFIRYARDDLAVFGADLDWDAPTWELRGVAKVSGRPKTLRVRWGHPLQKSPQSIEDYAPLDAHNLDFFKAYIRYKLRTCPADERWPHAVGNAAPRQGSSPGPASRLPKRRCDDFNVAAAACRSIYSLETSYRVGRQIEALSPLPRRSWTRGGPSRLDLPHQAAHDTSIALGSNGDGSGTGNVPRNAPLPRLGKPTVAPGDPMDVIAVSAYALLLATHSRISELHRLDAYDCEVETIDDGETTLWPALVPIEGRATGDTLDPHRLRAAGKRCLAADT